MGFIKANIIPVLEESKRRPFKGRLLLLGQGDIYFSDDAYRQMAQMVGVELDGSVQPALSYKPDFAEKGCLDTQSVFRRLGFSEVMALDCSDFEGADILHDMNAPDIPEQWRGQFDVVMDHGTLEHIFHFPNAMHAVFQFLKIGGRAITSSPVSGFFDHGFYMMQPTLFRDFYAANAWEVNAIKVVQFTSNEWTDPCTFVDYEPDQLDPSRYGKMDGNFCATFCVATKGAQSTGKVIPQQGWYARQAAWKPCSAVHASMADPV
ncbi:MULTISPECIES: hypothetical protein [unclassified Haematospirillum]|uniref:hypothetical protein n=1 Tax=unclassified Haematospirillum TaxID=2622088 RepID=UPI001439CE81|nr:MULTISPECIES: hypothetical protein [unclassified Haematospirillum]NKD55222.1 hypothetical protein [Haematospirillum sp. H4890]NKD75107.1 hypothetical protein [Haematospirillum sp. H4485]